MGKSNTQVNWPEGYREWTGDFNDLVRTTGEVVSALNPGTKAPSASLIRHYQQIKCVGRGRKQGRSSMFGFEELFQAVACKDMAGSGLGLDLTSHIVNNAAPAVRQAYADTPLEKNGAQTLVERLMQKSQDQHPQVSVCLEPRVGPMGAMGGVSTGQSRAFASMVGGPVRSAFMAGAIAHTPTSGGPVMTQSVSRHIKPCDGVDVYLAIDPDDPDGLSRAANALRATADSLEQPPTPKE